MCHVTNTDVKVRGQMVAINQIGLASGHQIWRQTHELFCCLLGRIKNFLMNQLGLFFIELNTIFLYLIFMLNLSKYFENFFHSVFYLFFCM